MITNYHNLSQSTVSSCHTFGKAPSTACKACDECQKLKNLLIDKEKQLSLQQQQLKVSETMAEEVTALARRCKAYEQRARRLTVATQGLAAKQLGMQSLSLSLSGSMDDSYLQKRSAASRLNKRNLEEKIDRLEASYDLNGDLDENSNGNKENSSTNHNHNRNQSLNHMNMLCSNGSASIDESAGDPSMSVKERILKKKLLTSSAALQPEAINSEAARQPNPRGRTKSGVSWGPVEVSDCDATIEATPENIRSSEAHDSSGASSVINDLTKEFIAAETNPNPNLTPNTKSAPAVSKEDQKARLLSSTTTTTTTTSDSASVCDNFTTKIGKKSVKARLLEVLTGMDCSDDERFDKMRLLLEIRAFQPKA